MKFLTGGWRPLPASGDDEDMLDVSPSSGLVGADCEHSDIFPQQVFEKRSLSASILIADTISSCSKSKSVMYSSARW